MENNNELAWQIATITAVIIFLLFSALFDKYSDWLRKFVCIIFLSAAVEVIMEAVLKLNFITSTDPVFLQKVFYAGIRSFQTFVAILCLIAIFTALFFKIKQNGPN